MAQHLLHGHHTVVKGMKQDVQKAQVLAQPWDTFRKSQGYTGQQN